VSALPQAADKSAAIPFADKPENLNGELAGDIGFGKATTYYHPPPLGMPQGSSAARDAAASER